MKIYKAKEVAKILGLTREKVQELCRNGDLKAFRTSSKEKAHWRITEAALMEFMSNK